MSKFTRETHTINGVKTVVHTAGSGEPVVFFHGGGTVEGFDFAEAWAERFRVIVPYHPGFGESGDARGLYAKHGLDPADIASSVRKFLRR